LYLESDICNRRRAWNCLLPKETRDYIDIRVHIEVVFQAKYCAMVQHEFRISRNDLQREAPFEPNVCDLSTSVFLVSRDSLIHSSSLSFVPLASPLLFLADLSHKCQMNSMEVQMFVIKQIFTYLEHSLRTSVTRHKNYNSY
jgi:hypothetical protein